MIKKSEITLKNVWAFFQGESRKIAESFFNSLPVHIKEQVEWRTKLVAEKSPACLEKGECVKCGCTIPDLFYADKQCKGGCYPEMIDDSKKWEDFKSQESINLSNKY